MVVLKRYLFYKHKKPLLNPSRKTEGASKVFNLHYSTKLIEFISELWEGIVKDHICHRWFENFHSRNLSVENVEGRRRKLLLAQKELAADLNNNRMRIQLN